MIGLLGGWGSGKSTVVRQIEKKFDGGEHIHFFTYDAWLHQNDPPRRSFLEALIGDLAAASIIKPAEWDPRLAQLSGKAEVTTTKTTRQFSETGRAIFLSLAFVPFGLGLLEYDLIDKAFGTGGVGVARPLLAFSLLAVLAPLLVILFYYLKWRPIAEKGTEGRWKALRTKAFWLEHDEAHKDQSVVALLTNHSVENAENKTKISPEPTAIEFRTVFNDLLASCRKKKRRLVIVIDNLDRLAENDAMQLWATIRSLFLSNNKMLSSEEGLAPPAIILPIDEKAIERMFAIQHDEEIAAQLSESFIDKTFDITFQINEPVMSDWRLYLADKLKEAFGDLANADCIYWATKIVERANPGTSASKRTTPRKLIKLINSSGALLAQWGDGSVDLLTMIHYVSRRADISKNGIAALVSEERSIIQTAVPDWRRQTLALHFGVAPEKAFQTLLAEPIRSATAANDRSAFDELIAGPGAIEVAEAVFAEPPLNDDRSAIDGTFVMNAALLVGRSASNDELWARRIIAGLADAWKTSAAPKNWRPDFADVLRLLLPAQDPQGGFLFGSARILSDMLARVKLDVDTFPEIAAALDTLRTVAAALNFQAPGVALKRPIDDLLSLLAELEPANRALLRTELAASVFVDALVTRLSDEELAKTVPEIVRRVADGSPTVQFKDNKKAAWNPLVEVAKQILQEQDFDESQTGPALDTIGLLRAYSGTAKTVCDELFDSTRLNVLAENADSIDEDNRLGDVLALMLLRGVDFPAPNGKSWDDLIAAKPDVVEAVDNALRWYLWKEGLPYLLGAMSSIPSAEPLIWALVKRAIDENGGQSIPTGFILKNIENIEKVLGADVLDAAIVRASKRDDFWAGVEAMPLGRNLNRVIRGLAKAIDVDRDRLIQLVRARLESVDLAGWRKVILENVAPAALIKIYRDELGEKKSFGEEMRGALAEQVGPLLQTSDEIRQRWFDLSQFVSKSMRATLYRHLRDALHSGAEVARLDSLLTAGGMTLLIEGKFSDDADKTVRHLVQPMLRSEAGRKLLTETGSFFETAVSGSDTETRNAIEEFLSASEADEELAVEMAGVRSALKLLAKKPAAQDDNNKDDMVPPTES